MSTPSSAAVRCAAIVAGAALMAVGAASAQAADPPPARVGTAPAEPVPDQGDATATPTPTDRVVSARLKGRRVIVRLQCAGSGKVRLTRRRHVQLASRRFACRDGHAATTSPRALVLPPGRPACTLLRLPSRRQVMCL